MVFYFIYFEIGNKIIQIKPTINHNWNAVAKLSIKLPAIHGIVKALIPKHWEYNAMAEPRYLTGEEFIIAFEAVGRNMHREIVSGMKAKSTKKYP